MQSSIEKVTAFVIRRAPDGDQLLLFEHPSAGIQIPAGTVEVAETPEAAALREATEETGLSGLSVHQYLGCIDERPPDGFRLIAQPTRVFARPDTTSFAWAQFRRGITVRLERQAAGFSQVTYEEFDQDLTPQYVTYRITGWVHDQALAETKIRHFFQFLYDGPARERWQVETDNHQFTLFWAPLRALPAIIPPQDRWLAMLPALDRSQ
jgi:8-oxo-dGTP pyrophosphatase MutT (NUDIX family)